MPYVCVGRKPRVKDRVGQISVKASWDHALLTIGTSALRRGVLREYAPLSEGDPPNLTQIPST